MATSPRSYDDMCLHLETCSTIKEMPLELLLLLLEGGQQVHYTTRPRVRMTRQTGSLLSTGESE